MAQALIPFVNGNQYAIPKGLTQTTTPQGGTAYTDTAGTYGTAGTMYIKGANGYTIAPNALPANTPNVTNVTNPTSPADITGTVQPDTTKVVQPAPVTAPAPTPTPTPTPTPAPGTSASGTVLPSVSTALESAANSEGTALSSIPTSTPATPIDYTLHPGETIDQYNARIASEEAAAGVSTATTSTPTTSSGLPSISDYLSALGPAPTPPDLNADQTAEENAVGIPAIQSNITTLNTQLTNLQNQIQQEQAGEASKPGVIASIINGRMTMISATAANALAQLKSQITAATTQLNQANTAVTAFMKNDETDYTNASAAYEKAYSDAITQYNDAVTEQDKQQANAKANAQVIINSYKGSSVGVNSITPDQEASWTALEQQAGLPPGTILAAVTAELTITKFSKGSDGNTYVTGVDNNGNPYVAQVQGSQGSGTGAGSTTGTWTKSQANANASKMSAALQAAAGADGMVSDSTWAQAESDWIAAGGTAASFQTQFKSFKSTNASAGNS